jgi:hypothetical protein
MKVLTRCSWGVFLLLLILLETGATSGITIAQSDEACSTTPDAAVSQMLDLTSSDRWLTFLRELTGEYPVMVSGNYHSITSRYSPNLFDGSENALAYKYIKEQLAAMRYPSNTIPGRYGYLEHEYTYGGNIWKNLILTIPGQSAVRRELIISAHLDDLPEGNGPGAEDNGVGAAALLEMARVLRYYQFEVTLHLIWFTGEEQNLRGSREYLLDYGMFAEYLIGVINLDMFGYDSDDDDCFEIHAGGLTDSYILGDCLVNSITAYSLPLKFDYIKNPELVAASDHLSFWEDGFGAIEILENHFTLQAADAYHQCGEHADANPYYHTSDDTVANSIDVPLAYNLVKASLATAATISEPLGACFDTQPVLTLMSSIPYVNLHWERMGTMVSFRLYRSFNGCGGPWQKLGDYLNTDHYYDYPTDVTGLAYQLEALAPSGMCYSLPSNCITDISIYRTYLPLTVR